MSEITITPNSYNMVEFIGSGSAYYENLGKAYDGDSSTYAYIYATEVDSATDGSVVLRYPFVFPTIERAQFATIQFSIVESKLNSIPANTCYFRIVADNTVLSETKVGSGNNNTINYPYSSGVIDQLLSANDVWFEVQIQVISGLTELKLHSIEARLNYDILPLINKVKVNNSWEEAEPYVKVNGGWKKATNAFVKVNDEWEEMV